MGRFILKRLLLVIPIVFSVTLIIFSIMNLSTDQIAYQMLGSEATQEMVDALNHKLGLDRPFFIRFFDYIRNILVEQSLGKSYTYGREVLPEILRKLPVSIYLSFGGMMVAVVLGIPLGILAAVKQYSISDRVATVASLFVAAIPSFWMAMMMMLLFSLKLRWLPTSGNASWTGYILPVTVLGVHYAAQQLRYTRSSMLETIRQNYIDTARSKGVPEQKVIWKHALKNALLPVITVVGANFGGLIGGAVVNETIFALPGVGSYMMSGIKTHDTPVVCGCVVVLSAVFSTIMLLVDVMHAAVDPRIKARYSKKR